MKLDIHFEGFGLEGFNPFGGQRKIAFSSVKTFEYSLLTVGGPYFRSG
jgi:hypothetical protein